LGRIGDSRGGRRKDRSTECSCEGVLVKKAIRTTEARAARATTCAYIHLALFLTSMFFVLTFDKKKKKKEKTGNPVFLRNFLVLICSLSSHRHSYIDFIFSSRFIDS
jgi:hypothetical protein